MYLFYHQNETEIFAPVTGGAAKMADEMAIPFLGRLPLDPRIGNIISFLFLFSFESTAEIKLDLGFRFTDSVHIFGALN